MPALALLERHIWWFAVAGHFVLALKLRRSALHRVYRFFYYYLLFRVFRSLLLEFGPPIVQALRGRPHVRFANDIYGYLWIGTLPLMWLLYILVVLELYSLVLQKYRGIASLSRWVLMAGLFLSLLISSAMVPADLSNPNEQFPVLRYFFAMDRGVLFSLVIFLLCVTGFLAWYPVPLSRNVVVHCVAFAAYFLLTTLAVMVRNLGGSGITQAANVSLSVATLGCIVVWIALMGAKGEQAVAQVRPQWMPGEEERLVRQLAAINSSLLRVARK